MLTVEIKVNGVLVGHIYCRNITFDSSFPVKALNGDANIYEYEYYKIGKTELTGGNLQHNQKDGALKLIGEIIKKLLANGNS